MSPKTLPLAAAVAVWDRAVHFDESLSPTAARALLKLRFPPQDVARMQDLAAKSRRDELTESEDLEIDTFERMGCLFDILHSKERRMLSSHRRSA